MSLFRNLVGASAAAATLTAVARRVRKHAQRIVTPLGIWSTLPVAQERHVGIVYNPSKSSTHAVVNILERTVVANGWKPALVSTTRIDEPGTQAARDLIDRGVDTLLAVGGDGTVRAVAAAIQEARSLGKDVTLGIIPLGTGNLLARNLRLPITDIAACINIALNGTHQMVDAIDMSAESAEGDVTNHMFYVMSGAGFDALVMNDANEDLKARIGWLAYVHSGLNHIFGHSHKVRIQLDDDEPFEARARSVLIANCGRLQGGLQLTDITEVNDGNLEVIIVSPRTILEWGLLTAKVVRRALPGSSRTSLPVMRHYVGHRVSLDMLSGAQPIEVDGDLAPSAIRLQARIVPSALSVNVHPDALTA